MKSRRQWIVASLPFIIVCSILYFSQELRSSGGQLFHYIHEAETYQQRTLTVQPTQRPHDSHKLSLINSPNTVMQKLNSSSQGACYVYILIWRNAGEEQIALGLDSWQKATCKNGLPCGIKILYSTSFEEMQRSDLVIFMPGPFKNFRWEKLLAARPLGQQWALYARESPVHEPQFTPPRELTIENPYNFTMTMRSDSDEQIAWGFYYPGKAPVPSADKINWARGKTKLILWIASRCDPLGYERTKLVEAIQEHLPVDVYGKCGPYECPKRDKSCSKVFQQYKFYLAFENSECKEYITEKFWDNSFGDNMVPIAYGAPAEDYKRMAPPKSYIHLEDFKTMEEFVNYIKLLDSNDTLYSEYFHWKKKGGWTNGPGHRTTLSPAGLCTVVKLMKRNIMHPEMSWRYKTPDFNEWWGKTCRARESVIGVPIKVAKPVYGDNRFLN